MLKMTIIRNFLILSKGGGGVTRSLQVIVPIQDDSNYPI